MTSVFTHVLLSQMSLYLFIFCGKVSQALYFIEAIKLLSSTICRVLELFNLTCAGKGALKRARVTQKLADRGSRQLLICHRIDRTRSVLNLDDFFIHVLCDPHRGENLLE